MVGNLRYEVVLVGARHVVHVAPSAVLEYAGASAHHVGVYIYGINRVGHADGVVPPHYFAYVSRVALRSVVDENLAWVEVYSAWCEVVFHYGAAQEVVAPLRTVAVECGFFSHFVHRLVHGFYHGGTQRLCHIAYAEADYTHLRMCHLEGVHLLGNVCEQVVVRQFQEMFVY